MRKSIFGVTAGVILTLVMTPTHAEAFNAQKGEIWTGGAFNLISSGSHLKIADVKIPRQYTILLSPAVRFFPVNNLILGPKLSWVAVSQGKESASVWGLGFETGWMASSRAHSYLIASPHFSWVSGSNFSTQSIFMLPFSIGVMSEISGDLGIQMEAGYSLGFTRFATTNTFSIGFGVCGLGEKVAISIVNVINALNSTD